MGLLEIVGRTASGNDARRFVVDADAAAASAFDIVGCPQCARGQLGSRAILESCRSFRNEGQSFRGTWCSR